ncbi:fluoride efflux transporter FluC [Rhodohalobacter halophilus]|uniref:fluoride efflux transporter FluC n=1 Tax=Rhodohalobacter halophilus TaxID=1812810 RepID=UPI00083F770C|nr:CrcB family protein [Rhodohalobacter halophilus]
MLDFFFIAVGGAVGACLRYLTSIASIPINKHTSFITGTVFANSFGCLFSGAFAAVISVSSPFSNEVAMMLSIGVLGSYTTFSTFSLEVFQRLDGSTRELAFYLFMQLVVAISLVFAGYSFTLHWIGGAA